MLGPTAIQDQHPHDRPKRSKKSPAPFFHAFTKSARKLFQEAYSIPGRLPGSRGEPASRRPDRSFSRGVLSTWAAFRDRLALKSGLVRRSTEAWVRDLSLAAPGKRDLVKECRDQVGIGGRFVEHPQPKLREVTLVQSQELQICPAAVYSHTFALKKRMAPNLCAPAPNLFPSARPPGLAALTETLRY